MTDFREGDWVEHKLTKCRGPVENISRGMLENPGGWSRVEMYEYCAPDPLPERLPKGTIAESCGFRCVAASEVRLEFGDRYRGNWDTDDFASFCFAKDIDWPSYWSALHAEQDAALVAEAASVADRPRKRCPGCGTDTELNGCFCALSPEERLARTVECPRCTAEIGRPCALPRGDVWLRESQPFHSARFARALARQAEQDSPGSSREDDSGSAHGTVAAQHGDSGQGRAAGSEVMTPISQPAAPSGFTKCAGLADVGGKACKAEAMGTSRLCGDCQAWLNEPQRRKRDQLRHDLDRPVPKALVTWPEHWATPGWES